MSGSSHTVMAGACMVLVFCLCAGCLSTTVGDAWYENQSVRTMISHPGDPAEVSVQVTVYKISNLSQERYTVISTPVSLVRGDNFVAVPGELPPGTYKLYIYVLDDGGRKTAVIRDIVV